MLPGFPLAVSSSFCLGISLWGVIVYHCSGRQQVRSSETGWTWRRMWDYGGNLRAGPSSCHKLGLFTLVLTRKFLLVPQGKATAKLRAQRSTLSVKLTKPCRSGDNTLKRGTWWAKAAAAVRCGSNLAKANQEQAVFYLLQCLSAVREPGDAPVWPWEHLPCGASLYTAFHDFPPRGRWSKGWRSCPMRKHWRSRVLSHCKREGSSQYSCSSRPAKRRTLFSQGTKWRRQEAMSTNYTRRGFILA